MARSSEQTQAHKKDRKFKNDLETNWIPLRRYCDGLFHFLHCYSSLKLYNREGINLKFQIQACFCLSFSIVVPDYPLLLVPMGHLQSCKVVVEDTVHQQHCIERSFANLSQLYKFYLQCTSNTTFDALCPAYTLQIGLPQLLGNASNTKQMPLIMYGIPSEVPCYWVHSFLKIFLDIMLHQSFLT